MGKVNLQSRNRQIRKLREKAWTLRTIGEKHNLSIERVRQICFMQVGQKAVLTEMVLNYKKNFNDSLSIKNLIKEIKFLSKKSRRAEYVRKREVLVKFLYDELHLSFLKIAVLLNRDHTTIMSSYYHE